MLKKLCNDKNTRLLVSEMLCKYNDDTYKYSIEKFDGFLTDMVYFVMTK
jgi:hypothetical protein